MTVILKLTRLPPSTPTGLIPSRALREEAPASVGAATTEDSDYVSENQATLATDAPCFQLPLPSRATRNIARTARVSTHGRLVGGRTPYVIQYESKLEADAAFVMLARPDLIDLIEQPLIGYHDEHGLACVKRFDFSAKMADGRCILVEVKPAARVTPALQRLLRSIAEQMPTAIATDIVIITEEQLPRPLVRNARLIHSARRSANSDDNEHVQAIAKTLHGAVTIRDLVMQSGLAGRGFRAVVHLISDGLLAPTDDGEIGYATMVRYTGNRAAAIAS